MSIKRNLKRKWNTGKAIALFGAAVMLINIFAGTAQAIQLSVGDFAQKNGTAWYDPTCAFTDGDENANAPVIVLDPGHSGEDKTVPIGDTGLNDHDYPTDPEMTDVWQIALDARKELQKAGYRVLVTKAKDASNPQENEAQNYMSLQDRAAVANDNNAALAVSIHTDPGQPWSFAQIYTQKSNKQTEDTLYRIGSKGKKTFGDIVGGELAEKLAKTSQDYGIKFQDARRDTEDRGDQKLLTNADFPPSRTGVNPGNMPFVQMLSKVPWIYNEVGAAPKSTPLVKNKAHYEAYKNGIVEGVKKAIPIKNNGDGGKTSSENTGSSVQMVKVNLADFKPAHQARSAFKKNLPKIKKFVPLYVAAAQAEGVPQNWEILTGIHNTESDFGKTFKPNSLGYTGPFQQGPSELADYIDKPEYGKVLSTLIVRKGGHWEPRSDVGTLTDEQFIVLARLVFHRWVRQGLGNDFNKLKQGPVAFTKPNDVNNNNVFWKIMTRYNNGAQKYQGFNGYNEKGEGPFPWGIGTEVGSSFSHPGVATTYYLLKDWEANGGMSTIDAAGGGGCNDADGQSTNTGSPDCQTAQGNAKILCEAKKYDPVSYEMSVRGGHQGSANWHKTCPKIGPSCLLDCSGLVSVAVYDAFFNDGKTQLNWTTDSLRADTKNWKKIPLSDIKPGDVVEPHTTHVEIVDHVSGNTIHTFGAHTARYPQPKQVGPTTMSKGGISAGAYRYIGKGSTP